MFKEFPPEVSRLNDPSLSLDLDDPRKNLISPQRTFNLRLRIPDHIIAVLFSLIYTVHHILTGITLIKDHIASAEFSVRLCKVDIIPVVT